MNINLTDITKNIGNTIAKIKNNNELNGNGIFTAPPATMFIAIASPRALPTPSTTPVSIPDLAAGITTLNIV